MGIQPFVIHLVNRLFFAHFLMPRVKSFHIQNLVHSFVFFGLFAPNVIVNVFSTVKMSINAIVYSKPGLHLPLITHSFINTLADNPMCHRTFYFPQEDVSVGFCLSEEHQLYPLLA